jgi:hypothetical protein
MSKYQVGDKAWAGQCKWVTTYITCDTCAGKRKVHLILGNGDIAELPCQACTSGFESPIGRIPVHGYSATPELITITGIRTEQNDTEITTEYLVSNSSCPTRIFQEESLFETEAEAQAYGEKKKVELEAEMHRDEAYRKANDYRKYSQSYAYHFRLIAELRRKIKYHEEQAKLCKEKKIDASKKI